MVNWDFLKIAEPEPIEFRVYYNETTGNVICYTCEKLDGLYLLVDKDTFAEARIDVKVIEGELIRNDDGLFITKLIPGDDGVLCSTEDVCIIVDEDYTGDTRYWSTKQYEFRHN